MDDQSFLGNLFDLSFSNFVTTRLIKVLFVLGIAGSGIWSLMILVGLMSQHRILGFLLGVIVAPIVFAVGVLVARVYTELLIVAFRIAENTARLVELGEREALPVNQPPLDPQEGIE